MSNLRSLLGSQLMASKATKNGMPTSTETTSSYDNLRTSGHIRTLIAPLKDSGDVSHVRTIIAPLKDGGLQAALKKESFYSKSLGADDESGFKMQRRSSAQSPSSMSFSGYLLKRSNHPFSFPVEVTTTSNESLRNNQAFLPELPSLLPNSRIINIGNNVNEENEIDIAASMAAAFFGVSEQPTPRILPPPILPPPPIVKVTNSPKIRTKPMPLPKRTSSDSSRLSQQLSRDTSPKLHRQTSSPESGNSNHAPPPPDYVDPIDGHIWRAKFCVLENGILYFYRHVTDAYSPEAKRERNSISLFDDRKEDDVRKCEFLSKSPMPRNYMQLAKQQSEDNLQESFHTDPNIIWEKKVSLDSVGAVRSAEDDFGTNSFVLLTEDNSTIGGTDCLILKAASQEDMQEWLFQFHCTLATFMRHIVKTYIAPLKSVGSTGAGPASNWVEQHNHHYLPENTTLDILPTSTLSHGHGRVQMMRKMRAEKRSRGTVTSSLGGDVSPTLSESPREMITPPSDFFAKSPEHKSIVVVTKKEPEPKLAVVKPKKYIPPHKRKNLKPPSSSSPKNQFKPKSMQDDIFRPKDKGIKISPEHLPHPSLTLGGCADTILFGSILDIIHNQTILKSKNKYKSTAYGTANSKFEVGAVSERGVRESNEDAFLICTDLTLLNEKVFSDPSSLFAIFDGHCGDQCARYASETFINFLQESIVQKNGDGMEEMLNDAIHRLDTSICNICQDGGRDWGCGATALITLLVKDKLILANVGDCRGVFCTSKPHPDWKELSHDNINTSNNKSYHWKTLTQIHTPSKPSEMTRIEKANGWITVEHESCLAGQLHRMDFCDDDVVNILKRWFSDRFDDSEHDFKRILKISRVCGELSVSRALGDVDFKAAFNPISKEEPPISIDKITWEGPDFLPYPKAHSMKFHDDLISGKPDIEVMTVIPGFLILACDGLWDVMDPYDAVLVIKDLIYDKGWSAKKAAARLAELAIHLGSSDNTTVILIRFFDDDENATNEIKSNR